MTTTGYVVVQKIVADEVIVQERRQLIAWHCGGCGVLYALDAEYVAERRRDGKSFYCPNGCCRSYRETETHRLRQQLESAQGDVAWYRAELARESKSHSDTKGQLTRAKKRIENGVCLHCHRHFTDLARHMKTEHTEESA